MTTVLVLLIPLVIGVIELVLMDIVVGTAPVDDPEVEEPEEVMLNILDWARMAALFSEDDMRLIWKAVPVGQAPEE